MLEIFCLLLLFFVGNLQASEILVEPSVISVNNVGLGKKFELQVSSPGSAGYFLAVANTGDKRANYAISILSCKEYGCNPYFGYQDIPDVRWIETKAVSGKQLAVSRKGNLTEITLSAGETGYVRNIFIKIPKKKEYYNQRWQAVVKVIKKASPGEMVNLEVILPLWIETEKKPASFFKKIFGGIFRK